MRFIIIFSFFCFSISNITYSQDNRGRENDSTRSKKNTQRTLLDDSTKVIYGMNTSMYIMKNNLLEGDTNFIQIDSSLNNFEKFSVFENNKMRYQNLGNIGTALNDILDKTPNSFTKVSGFNTLDPYYNILSNNKFYDTKSPLIDMNLVFGGQGRNKVDFLFTRNINKNWNIGFDIHRTIADKQIGSTKTKGDRNINSSSFNFFVYHLSNNKKLKFYSNIVNYNNQTLGTGGINIEVDDLPLEFFLYNDSEVNLSSIESNDKRKSYNVVFEYRLFKKFNIYYNLEYYSQKVNYNDENIALNSDFYDIILHNNTITADSFELSVLKNKIGFKGILANINYNVYANSNLLFYKFSLDTLKTNLNENLIGSNVSFKKNDFLINGLFNLKTNGNYELKGKIKNKYFTASYTSGLYNPDIIENNYNGNHNHWNNDFKSKFLNKLSFKLNVKSKSIFFSPRVELISINNHIYFSDSKNPIQHDKLINYNLLGFDLKYSFFNNLLNFENEYYYSLINSSNNNILQLPSHHNYSKLYYSDSWFKKSIPVQLGVNIFYRSKYFGNAYDPVMQKFYNQNTFELKNSLRTNIFFSMQIQNLRLFVKMTHFNQFDKYDGYFITPYYPAQKKVLDLGVRWYFFN